MSHSENRQNMQEKMANEQLVKLLEENFSRVFELLAPIINFSTHNENRIRQIIEILTTQKGEASESETKAVDTSGTSNNHQLEMSHEGEEESKPGTSADAIKSEPKPVRQARKRKSDVNDVIHCPDCNQDFVRGDGTYTLHLKILKCSPHECPICLKRFKKKSYLNVHVAGHSSTKEATEPPAKVRRTISPAEAKQLDETSNDASETSSDSNDATAKIDDNQNNESKTFDNMREIFYGKDNE